MDWVPIASQSHAKIATPPPALDSHATTYSDVQDTTADPNRPTKEVHFNIGEAGPEGCVPILRPDISKLKSLSDLDHSLSKRGGLLVNVNRANKKPTDPNPAGYFSLHKRSNIPGFWLRRLVHVWDPQVNIPSSPGDDHSISQTWLQNYQKPLTQSIEAGLTVDRTLNGDLANHIFSYYTTNGYTKDADNVGGYNHIHNGWIQFHASIFPGIRINGSSVQGGAQLEIGLKYQLFNGNWWLGFNNNQAGPWIWLGYYPASLFNGGIGNPADFVSFGGEVFSALANPCSTTDQMGSGRHAAASFGHSTFQRNLRNQSNSGGSMVNFNGVAEVDSAANNCPERLGKQSSRSPILVSRPRWCSAQVASASAEEKPRTLGGIGASFLRYSTSGKTGEDCAALKEGIVSAIDWRNIGLANFPPLFKRLKEEIVRPKRPGARLNAVE